MQFGFVLIGPEARHAVVRPGFSGYGEPGSLGLILGVLDRFQTKPALRMGIVVIGAVAGRENSGIAGHAVFVDDDTIGAVQLRIARQLVVRHAADSHKNEIRAQLRAALRRHEARAAIVFFDSRNALVEPHIDAMPGVQVEQEL